MEIGTGIFLSSVFIGLVILFVSTKDRWNWKKITFRLFICFAIVGLLLGGWFWYLTYKNNKIVKIDEFFNLSVGMSKNDTKFIHGEPDRTLREGKIWIYHDKYDKDIFRAIRFTNDRIRFVQLVSPNVTFKDCFKESYISQNGQSLLEIYGQPSTIDTSQDGLTKLYSYEEYGYVFSLEKNKVGSCGIYDTKLGPVLYSKD